MLSYGPWLLQCARTYGQRFFLRFGLHCATHQIRVIVISSVVITSLFYPALALYSSSQPKSLSILDAFVSSNALSGIHAQQDLVNVWEPYTSLRVREDPVSRAICGAGRVLRVERILIQSPLTEGDGALNHQILLSTWNLENRLEKVLSSRKIPCVKGPDGRCLVLTPLAFWAHDKEALVSDTNILDTLSLYKNVSIAGIPVTPPMVLAGRGSHEHHVGGANFDFATFLALTYIFPDSACSGNAERSSWLQAVESATPHNAELLNQIQEPTMIALEYDSELSKKKGWTAISAFLYLAYLCFFAYVSWSMRQMNAVHSRIGLTFTALVEIAVSTITSLSVCALVGFKVTMVPWELLPLMIVFVGAENMFNLVDVVTKTSITLPVRQRIAEGLSRAGTSNTLKVVSYNAILGVIAVFAAGAIRQFCVFAIVVLVAHWFLAHTFFIAVLSIDIQRLELEELLRQNSALTPAVPQIEPKQRPSKHRTIWQTVVHLTQLVFRGRAKKNLSLFLLLATTATLYYATLPAGHINIEAVSSPRGALSRTSNATTPDKHDPAWQIWKTLNPAEVTLHLRIEMPSIVTFWPDVDDPEGLKEQKTHRPRLSKRSFRFMLWLFKIMVLPITATASALGVFMHYLLKDAELLEAQKSRAEPDDKETPEVATALEREVSFSTLPRAFDSDVELIATSKDGQVIVSVGVQNELVIWLALTESQIIVDAADVLLQAASTSSTTSTLTCVAVDDNGEYCAVGTAAGVVAVWAIRSDDVEPLPHLSLNGSTAGVVELQFASSPSPSIHATPPHSKQASPTEPPFLVATYETGAAAKWSLRDFSSAKCLTPTRPASLVRSSLTRIAPDERLAIAFCMDDGTLELCEVEDLPWIISPEYSIQAGNPTDIVRKVHVCRTVMAGETRTIVCAATEAGVVSLWDGQTGELIRILEDVYGTITQLRLSPDQCETCRFCGHLPLDSFLLSFSVGPIIRFFKVYLADDTRRCSCTPTRPRKMASRETIGRLSRSNSVSSSIGSHSPIMGRSRVSSTAYDTSPFPVSGHGIHSRRASDKDITRRTSESFTLGLPGDDQEPSHFGPLDAPQSQTGSITSFWNSIFVINIADTSCDRGGWDVAERRVVGVRRRPRPRKTSTEAAAKLTPAISTDGLTSSILDRWELWTFDPLEANLQTSALSALIESGDSTSLPSSPTLPSSRRIPRLPFTRVSPFVISHSRGLAGFGNTLGVFNFLS